MALTFTDAEQQSAFELHIADLESAEPNDLKSAYKIAHRAAMLLLQAPTTLENEAEHYRLTQLVVRYRTMG